jgi:hypothetical protein
VLPDQETDWVRSDSAEASQNYEQLKRIAGIVGQWEMSGAWEDGTPFQGEESTEWCLNKNFLRSSGWFKNHDGERVDYHIVTGWDPSSKQIVEWFSASNGGHSKRVGTWEAKANAWDSHETGVDADGKEFSFNVSMTMLDENTWSWVGTNFQGQEKLPDLKFKFRRVGTR